MSHVLLNISRGRFFEPIFTSKKFDLYTSIYGSDRGGNLASAYFLMCSGLLTRCGQKWGIVWHYEGQLCGKKYKLCGKLCSSQFLILNVFFLGGGVLKNVLIGILVYLSDGIDTLLVEILFYFDVR